MAPGKCHFTRVCDRGRSRFKGTNVWVICPIACNKSHTIGHKVFSLNWRTFSTFGITYLAPLHKFSSTPPYSFDNQIAPKRTHGPFVSTAQRALAGTHERSSGKEERRNGVVTIFVMSDKFWRCYDRNCMVLSIMSRVLDQTLVVAESSWVIGLADQLEASVNPSGSEVTDA